MLNMKFTTGNSVVDSVGRINISGNVIPMSWYKTIVRETGKPYLEAITILADIVYWYRPTEIRDEQTGLVIEYRKKFKADLLQRSYQQIANMFGISKREATNAIVRLEKLGVIKRVFRTLNINDVVTSNVLFLELIPERLKKLTFGTEPQETAESSQKEIGITFKSERGHLQKGDLYTRSGGTYTEITSEITSETSVMKENVKEKVDSDEQSSPPPPTEKKESVKYQKVVDSFNKTCTSLPQVRSLTDKRKRAIKLILKKYSLKELEMVFKKVEESAFLNGSSDKWSGATFDWILKESNLIKVIEGNYDDKGKYNNFHSIPSYDIEEYEKNDNYENYLSNFVDKRST